ncbi:MAG: histidinol-phosphate aminotransferase family protein [Euryarchaeota archaeon]|nr:histidinol-phosphate aminotransferase family protein [Euryarchaeota archaeon]
MKFDPRAAMRRSIHHLAPYYRAPREPLLRMDQNTNLVGRNPTLGRIGLDRLEFNQYPTRDADDLIAGLESHYALPEGSVLAGNGSDEILDIVLKGFTDPGDSLVVPSPSYSLYPFYAALHDLRFEEVPLDLDHRTDMDGLLAAAGKVTLVASPNNPTGGAVPRDDLVRLVEEAPGLVVVDEAYIEYADEGTLLPLVTSQRNLVVMRTFSKAYALAGARLGWLAAHPDTTAVLGLVKPPFNVNVVTEAIGLQALKEQAFVEEGVAVVRSERPRLAAALAERGFEVVPSDANFLLTFPPDGLDGPVLAERLHAAGIAARIFPRVARLARAIRFTVGPRADNERLLSTLDQVLGARRIDQEGAA